VLTTVEPRTPRAHRGDRRDRPADLGALASEFETLGALDEARSEDLATVDGVGPHTAALLEARAEDSFC